jgi:hypothetical protein
MKSKRRLLRAHLAGSGSHHRLEPDDRRKEPHVKEQLTNAVMDLVCRPALAGSTEASDTDVVAPRTISDDVMRCRTQPLVGWDLYWFGGASESMAVRAQARRVSCR